MTQCKIGRATLVIAAYACVVVPAEAVLQLLWWLLGVVWCYVRGPGPWIMGGRIPAYGYIVFPGLGLCLAILEVQVVRFFGLLVNRPSETKFPPGDMRSQVSAGANAPSFAWPVIWSMWIAKIIGYALMLYSPWASFFLTSRGSIVGAPIIYAFALIFALMMSADQLERALPTVRLNTPKMTADMAVPFLTVILLATAGLMLFVHLLIATYWQ